MGLFSKKTIKCTKCGKACQVWIVQQDYICDECMNKEIEKQKKVQGYVDYARRVLSTSYTEEQFEELAVYRDNILERYSIEDSVLGSDKRAYMEGTKLLSQDQETNEVLKMVVNSVVMQYGAAFSRDFFVLTDFDKVVVDAKDVFAVGYTAAFKVEAHNSEVILCAVFTNDPYIPVFPMVFVSKMGFFEVMKSKKGREAVEKFFNERCPELKYPVQELKTLKKQVKTEGTVHGNIDKQFMLEKISDASLESGIFDARVICRVLSSETVELLQQYGYTVFGWEK